MSSSLGFNGSDRKALSSIDDDSGWEVSSSIYNDSDWKTLPGIDTIQIAEPVRPRAESFVRIGDGRQPDSSVLHPADP